MLQNKEKGFTIIEVVLVLAIAGLIFMVVFLALPGLQNSQKDTQRKQDVGRLVSTITTYQSNHKGSLPQSDEDGDSLEDMLKQGGSAFADPSSGAPYNIVVEYGPTTKVPVADSTSTITLAVSSGSGVACGSGVEGGDPDAIMSSGSAAFAVITKMADGSAYCQEA
jgi:prepilin-type N-terminal cleavage/methylation domain-containing protein